MKNLYYIIIFLVITFCGCKKDDVTPKAFIGTYTSSSTATVSSTIMYTKHSVITDWSIFKPFLKYQIYPEYKSPTYILNSKDTTINTGIIKLTINAKNSATIDRYGQFFSGKIEYNQNEMIIRALKPDTVIFPFYFLPELQIEKPITPLSYYDPKYIAGVTPTPPGFSIGSWGTSYYPFISTKKQLFVVKGNELYLSMLSTRLKTIKGVSSISVSNGFGNYLNVVNPNIQNGLDERDTIIVQQLLVKMIKQ